MSDYTKINFMDIDGGEGDLQMRFARKHLAKDVDVTLTKHSPNYRNPGAHHHEARKKFT